MSIKEKIINALKKENRRFLTKTACLERNQTDQEEYLSHLD